MELLLPILLASAANAVSQVMLKKGMAGLLKDRRKARPVLRLLLAPQLWAGMVLFGVSLSLYLVSLRRLDIMVAFPAMGITYVFVAVLSRILLKESFNGWKAAGIIAILLGTLMVAAGGART